MSVMTIYWIAFVVIFLVVFIIDFYFTGHRGGEISVKTSLRWTALWIGIALLFGASLFFFFPQNPDSTVNTAQVMGTKFIAGYLTEYSLSVDNLFVFMMIFSLMGVSPKNQPKLLELGILLSIVLRVLFILVGMELVERFHWIMYIFGAILIWTAYKMAFPKGEEKVNPEGNILYKAAAKIFPIDPDRDASYFFKRIGGKLHVTTTFLVLLVIGSTDVVFAVDSIPAIIGVIKEGASGVLTPGEEQFLAITSNVFAVMGLISLYFALKGIINMFRFLKHGVSFILFFIGAKMLLSAFKPVENFFANNSWVSLVVIISTLTLSILLSIIIDNAKKIRELKSEVQKIKEGKEE